MRDDAGEEHKASEERRATAIATKKLDRTDTERDAPMRRLEELSLGKDQLQPAAAVGSSSSSGKGPGRGTGDSSGTTDDRTLVGDTMAGSRVCVVSAMNPWVKVWRTCTKVPGRRKFLLWSRTRMVNKSGQRRRMRRRREAVCGSDAREPAGQERCSDPGA